LTRRISPDIVPNVAVELKYMLTGIHTLCQASIEEPTVDERPGNAAIAAPVGDVAAIVAFRFSAVQPLQSWKLEQHRRIGIPDFPVHPAFLDPSNLTSILSPTPPLAAYRGGQGVDRSSWSERG
jgi:hypothetical protein